MHSLYGYCCCYYDWIVIWNAYGLFIKLYSPYSWVLYWNEIRFCCEWYRKNSLTPIQMWNYIIELPLGHWLISVIIYLTVNIMHIESVTCLYHPRFSVRMNMCICMFSVFSAIIFIPFPYDIFHTYSYVPKHIVYAHISHSHYTPCLVFIYQSMANGVLIVRMTW